METATHKPILYPYQQEWVGDRSRLKIAVKSTQIGFSFTEAYDDVVDSLEIDRNLWCILSRSERQALEFARKCKEHCNAIGAVAELMENQSFQGTSMLQHVIEFPNRSRIITLTSNPDTARGYTGNMVLDEFAFHKDSKAVFAAAYGRATLGFKLRVISTPFGEDGKFYELAKLADLVSGRLPEKMHPMWSGHWCDIHRAAAMGLKDAFGRPIDVEQVLAGVEDEDIRKQEYLCIFLSGATAWIPWELIVAAEADGCEVVNIGRDDSPADALAKVEEAIAKLPVAAEAEAEVGLGSDIGRKRDLTVFSLTWHFKALNMYRVPLMVRMAARKFKEQRAVAEMLIERCRVHRACQDATGIGAQLAEELQEKYGESRVEAINFTMPVKADLATTTKRPFEDRAIAIPANSFVRAGIHAVRRYTTSAGNFRFDAERTDAGHADEFWSIGLGLHAVSSALPVASAGCEAPEDTYRAHRRGLLAQGQELGTASGWSQTCPECGQIVPAFYEDERGEVKRVRDCKFCDAPLPPMEAPALEAAAAGRETRGSILMPGGRR